MCGLFGAIGFKWDKNIIRTLAICNRDRGTDSLGFFDSSKRIIKEAKDPLIVLSDKNITRWLNNSSRYSWFIAGHTRFKTRGAANHRNAHPFKYGNIIGSHNGMIDAPKFYNVDSEYLFDELNKYNGDYNEAWGDISGYWGVSWYDEKGFYLQVHDNDLYIVLIDGIWYYSSDRKHLLAAIGYNSDVYEIKENETWKFISINKKIVHEKVDDLVCYAQKYYKYTKYDDDYDYDYDDSYSYTCTYNIEPPEKEWDKEWKQAWTTYCKEKDIPFALTEK